MNEPLPTPNQTVQYQQYVSGIWKPLSSEVITEQPVSLTVNGEVWLTLMCTPIDLEALATGFLYNEGFIQGTEDVADVRVCDNQENVDVWLTQAVEKPRQWRRTTGCTGGVTSISTEYKGRPVVNGGIISPQKVCQLVARLFDVQDLYRKSGGVHTSALSDGEQILITAEDIGRHNTLDKIAGKLLMASLQPQRRILLTTGRISSEMLQKAGRINASILISRTSPSSLSIQMAERQGITLIGYARRNQFNVYTHPERMENILASEDRLDHTENETIGDRKYR
ncbi:MAG TPA: formate dehydrogenase accessory sulfurtransferase FdhD [Anaerolineales bacterium]|nr:formate dehydrogenase accessory sulfurtransferase FdhD [Anaerolineales bacterium]